MVNTQLQTLLDRCPLCEEDKYNVSVIFSALPSERQISILSNWETYASRLIAERQRLDKEQETEILETLKQANTILDAAIAQHQEQETKKEQTKQQIREELEATVAYDQLKKQQKIKQICAHI